MKKSIFITAFDEPVALNDFIAAIIKAKSTRIVGLSIIDMNRGVLGVVPKKKKIDNLISLLLIFGVTASIRHALRIFFVKMRKALHKLKPHLPSPSLESIAEKHGIPIWKFPHINDKKLIGLLEELKPDIIINQAPGIAKADFLNTAKIGVLNRHNSLLPKNRGLFSTFRALYNEEKETGVSIHFVEEKLDAGEILVQRRIKIRPHYTVERLATLCYAEAVQAMIEALDMLESDNCPLHPNPDADATYNTAPTLREAYLFRMKRIKRFLASP